MTTRRSRFQEWHWAGVLCVVGLTLSCEGAAESLTDQRAAEAVSSTPAAQQSIGQPVTLEFEPPPEFYQRTSDGGSSITGFRIGYFRAPTDGARAKREMAPLRTLDFKLDAVQITGRVARLSFKPEAMPAGNAQVVFRVQVLTAAGVSGFWSEPTEVMTLPERAVEPKAARRSRPDLETTLAKHPKLVEALSTLTKTSAENSAGNSVMYQAFGDVQDLAVAVVICRDHAVPCPELAKRMIGPPRQPLRAALRQWKDEKAIPALIRKARAESRGLLTGPRK